MCDRRNIFDIVQFSFVLWWNRNLKDRDAFSKSDPMCVLFMKQLAQDTFHEVSDTFHSSLDFNLRFV